MVSNLTTSIWKYAIYEYFLDYVYITFIFLVDVVSLNNSVTISVCIDVVGSQNKEAQTLQ